MDKQQKEVNKWKKKKKVALFMAEKGKRIKQKVRKK